MSRQRRKTKPRRKAKPNTSPGSDPSVPSDQTLPAALSPYDDFDDFTQDREITWESDSPTSGEKALAIIVLAAAAGIAAFIAWILSFSPTA